MSLFEEKWRLVVAQFDRRMQAEIAATYPFYTLPLFPVFPRKEKTMALKSNEHGRKAIRESAETVVRSAGKFADTRCSAGATLDLLDDVDTLLDENRRLRDAAAQNVLDKQGWAEDAERLRGESRKRDEKIKALEGDVACRERLRKVAEDECAAAKEYAAQWKGADAQIAEARRERDAARGELSLLRDSLTALSKGRVTGMTSTSAPGTRMPWVAQINLQEVK